MRLNLSFRSKSLFDANESSRIVDAIRQTEQQTSGEIRVFIESRCRFVDPLDRAAEIFWNLKMDHTKHRNAVLIYVAVKDHQFAVFADSGIHEKLGNEFWQKEVALMTRHFRENHYLDAILLVISDTGNALKQHFPYDPNADKNELPDDIVFGK
ncbi:MAG: TPM domain-containing protein [Chitinophagaceae bacterium]|nr:MAG: TPM domain-containing protein [Chitinophagaceae bacterium]